MARFTSTAESVLELFLVAIASNHFVWTFFTFFHIMDAVTFDVNFNYEDDNASETLGKQNNSRDPLFGSCLCYSVGTRPPDRDKHFQFFLCNSIYFTRFKTCLFIDMDIH